MKSAYFTFHPGRNPPPQNGCRLKSVLFFKTTGFTSSTFPIQPDFSQNQPDTVTLHTGSPRTLIQLLARLLARVCKNGLRFFVTRFMPAKNFSEPRHPGLARHAETNLRQLREGQSSI
jgi:hypothetical protein